MTAPALQEAIPQEKPRSPARRLDRERMLAEIRDSSGIDFTRWYSPTLGTRIGEVLDLVSYVPLALKRVVATLAIFVIGWYLAIGASGASAWVTVPALLWTIAAGLAVGAVVAVRGMVARGLGHLGEILDLVLQLAGNVVEDLGPRRAELVANARFPTHDDIVRGVLFAVILPTTEQVVRQRFRFLGRPMAWAFDRTIVRAVERLLAREHEENDGAAETESAPAAPPLTPDADRAYSKLVERTAGARRIVASVSGAAKRIGTFPLTVAVVVSATVLGGPLAVLAWLL